MPMFAIHHVAALSTDAVQDGYSGYLDAIHRSTPLMTEGNGADALALAELLAQEHAARLGVQMAAVTVRGDEGFSFVTNNGSRVWYTVRAQ